MSEQGTTWEYLLRLQEKRQACEARFRHLFRVQFGPFWNVATGFDLVKFDEEVIKSGDRCMRDVVIEQYGQEAADLLSRLIS